jgi:O-antigen/teichoic acid export membrane protein
MLPACCCWWALLRWIEGLSQTLYGRMQQTGQMKRLGRSQLLRAVIVSIGCPATLWASGSMVGMLAASGALQFLVLGCHDWPSVKPHPRTSADRRMAHRVERYLPMLRQAVSIGASTLLVAVSANIPRMVLARTAGEISLGAFTVLGYLGFRQAW